MLLLSRGIISMASTVLFGEELPLVEAPACAPELPVAPMLPEEPLLVPPDWSQPDEPLLPEVPELPELLELPELPELPEVPEVPVPMVPLLLELPLLPVGLPDASVALPEP